MHDIMFKQGFSLGAQVCSYMGKEAEGKLERVTGK